MITKVLSCLVHVCMCVGLDEWLIDAVGAIGEKILAERRDDGETDARLGAPQWGAARGLGLFRAAIHGALLRVFLLEDRPDASWEGTIQVDCGDGTRDVVDGVFGCGVTTWRRLGVHA
jgi:hypothetical protein